MTVLRSNVDVRSETYRANRAAMLRRIEEMDALIAEAIDKAWFWSTRRISLTPAAPWRTSTERSESTHSWHSMSQSSDESMLGPGSFIIAARTDASDAPPETVSPPPGSAWIG